MRLTPLCTLLFLAIAACIAEPTHVRLKLGATHGFVTIRSSQGARIGYGEFVEIAEADRLTSRLTLKFRDGSLDDETTVFTQNSNLRLVSDHHIQRGPFFPHPMDMLVKADGTVTIRTFEHDKPAKTESSHMDMPDDLSNGIIASILLNTPANAPDFKVSMIAASGKGRLIHLAVSREGEHSFSCVAGFPCKAIVFRIHPELGGIAGVVAPIIGKQPGDIMVWMRPGNVPSFVREVGSLGEGTEVVSIELGGTIFPR